MATASLSAVSSTSNACPKCGTTKASGKRSCCARGGAWFKNCGGAGDSQFDHTWAEGMQACNGHVLRGSFCNSHQPGCLATYHTRHCSQQRHASFRICVFCARIPPQKCWRRRLFTRAVAATTGVPSAVLPRDPGNVAVALEVVLGSIIAGTSAIQTSTIPGSMASRLAKVRF